MTDRKTVVTVAMALLVFTGIVHAILGLVDVVLGDVDVLSVAFVLAGVLAILLAAFSYGDLLAPRVTYALGAGLLVAYVLAYADWHAVGIVESVFGLDDAGLGHDHHDHGHDHHDHGHSHHDHHSHDGSAVTVLIDHLVADPIALVTKVAETAAAGLFVWLFVTEE